MAHLDESWLDDAGHLDQAYYAPHGSHDDEH